MAVIMIETHLAITGGLGGPEGQTRQDDAALRAIPVCLGGTSASIESLTVDDGVRLSGNYLQVLDAVIVFDLVNVVDEFRGEESSPEKHPHNVPVLKDKPPIYGYLLVALGGECTLPRCATNRVDVPVSFEPLVMLATQFQSEESPAASHNRTYLVHLPPLPYYNISYMSCQGDLVGL